MGIKNIEYEAEQGSVEALVKLGRIYLYGMGVEKDFKLAHNYFVRAAKQDSADAYSYLAYTYAMGLGVEKTDEKVITYFNKANDLGDNYAACALGFIYRKGLYGVEKDEKMALQYVEKASQNNFVPAKYEQALILSKEASKLSKSEDENDKKAANDMQQKITTLFEEASKGGYAPAQYALAIRCLDKKDNKKAFTLLSDAAKSGYPLVYFALGYCYDFAIGCDQDYKKSFENYQRAYDAGYRKAVLNLAYAYITGCGCAQNYKKAIDLCRDAVNSGIKEANHFAAMCFEYGLGVDQDYNKAVELYGYASEAGYEDSMLKLGQLSDPYYGVGQDEQNAKAEYEQAVDFGSYEAKAELARIAYKEDEKQLEVLQNMAKEGSAIANEALGTINKEDAKKALEFYKKAADLGSMKAAKEIVAIAETTNDNALKIKYEDKLLTFGTPRAYFERAKELKELKEMERSAFWYAFSGLTSQKEENKDKAKDILQAEFKKNPSNVWGAK